LICWLSTSIFSFAGFFYFLQLFPPVFEGIIGW
jgi:hypothetical protein